MIADPKKYTFKEREFFENRILNSFVDVSMRIQKEKNLMLS
jgi:hypothetical protein